MSRKLSVRSIQNSTRAFFGVLLLSIALLGTSGCATIAGKEARALKTERDNPVVAGKIDAALVGKWRKVQTDYAVYAENLGNFESYEISSDGRIRHETLSVAKNYDCLVEDSTRSDGAITVKSDSRLNITLDTGAASHQEVCAGNKNYTNPTKAMTADFQWKLAKTEDGRAELSLTTTDGETIRFRRAE
jgi:hypothetical protein